MVEISSRNNETLASRKLLQFQFSFERKEENVRRFSSLGGGMWLARCTHMAREFFCDHCERTLTSKAYRVISEDPGGVLLNMLVCHPCNQKAQELGLETREINLDELQLKRG